MLVDKGLHLLLAHGIHAVTQIEVVLLAPVLDDLVGTETLLALLAVHQGIGEAAHMTGGHPDLRIHQDSSIQTHIVGILLHELLPPGTLHIVLELHTQRAIVPGVGQTAVDLGTGENEAPVFAEVDNFFHGLFGVFHVFTSHLFSVSIMCPIIQELPIEIKSN